MGDFHDLKSLENASKEMAKKHKKERNNDHQGHLVLNKWMSFGGGFYGLMAFVTYGYIELKELSAFATKLFILNWDQFFSSVGIDLLVNFFINSIRNLIDAFVWFQFWPKVLLINNGWIWLGVAYVAYACGAYLAKSMPLSTLYKRIKDTRTKQV
ncbi:hypothetical protein GCM10007852_00750 [Agaribacter marinus]|uniref:Uncharacterized protein n=2 Tax=Agaribacter marinus TaxID=1431249 RepID=A0AA37WGP7_9ALTE|nr:hypothetical protein GCM10007852_00750 [Agaribacter marinus]